MKRILLLFIVLSACSSEEVPLPVESNAFLCENGFADIYPCNGYDLLAHVPLTVFSADEGNDIWGWADATTGKEYALIGLNDGTAFVDITNAEPIYLGKLPTATVASPWRDIKVFEDYAYIVSEAEDHGVQVFDLKKLRNVVNAPVIFSSDARYTDLGSAHNIVVNETSGFAYPVGTDRGDLFQGGVHFLDLQNPLSPNLAGGWGGNGYSHDAQVIIYNGPDLDYKGSEIFVGASEDKIVVVDISNKLEPVEIATLSYANVHYTHQGWFTEDHRYFIVGDELDELRQGFRTRTLIFDMSDLNNPLLHSTYSGPTSAIDHNGYVLGDEFFLSNYTAGLRVLDISNIEQGNIVEQGFFDTYPSNNDTQFAGAWSVYPYFGSGKIIISDINNGLFVVKKSD